MAWCCTWLIIFCVYWELLSLHKTTSYDYGPWIKKQFVKLSPWHHYPEQLSKELIWAWIKWRWKGEQKAEMIKAAVIELNGSEAERRGDCCTASLYWKQYIDGKGRKRNMGAPGTHIIWQYLHNRETSIAQTDVCGFFLATKNGLRVTCLHS